MAKTEMIRARVEPEVLEWRYPVLLEDFSIRRGSGGKGKYKGGNGVVRRLKFLAPMQASILSSNRSQAPKGMAGGKDGAIGVNRVERAHGTVEDLGPTATVNMTPGDIFIIETPGGGGFGEED